MFGRLFQKNAKQVSRPQLSQRVQLMVENLEQRLVPATPTITLSASAGVLVITGDANNDDFIIEQKSATEYEIIGQDSTAVAPPAGTDSAPVTTGGLTFTVETAGSAYLVDGVTGITANLVGGTDSITLEGDGRNGGSLSANLVINESSTAANLVVRDNGTDFNVTGQFKISTTGTSTINATLTAADTFGSVLINGGSGGSTVISRGSGMSDADFFSATFTGGTNSVQLSNAAIGSFVSFVGGSGDDFLELDNTTVGTVVGVNFGSSGVDGDELDIINSSVINGNLTVNGSGKVTDDILGTKTQVLGYTSLNSTGTGGTAVSIGGATLSNFLSVVTGGGTNSISIDNGATINGPFGFQSAGKLTLQIGGEGGTDTTTIAGNVFQTDAGGLTSETVRIGTDSDLSHTASTDIVNIQGWVSINAASLSGALTVTVDGQANTTVPTIGGAQLSIVGGKGNDSVELLDGATISGTFGYNLGAGAANVAITGPGTTVSGNVFQQDPGAGVTTNTFFLTNGASVGGFVSINSVSAKGATNVVIDGTGVSDPSKSVNTIGGFLSVVSGSGNDLLSITGATIASNVGWELGAGNDTVQTNNVLIQGGFFGDFGDGNDKLLTEDAAGILAQTFLAGNTANTVAQVQAGNTTVNGSINPATVYAGGATNPLEFLNMGAGNDSAELGGSATFQFVYGFTQPLVITAGAGTSTLNTHLSGGVSTSLSFTGGSVLQASGFTNLV